MSKMPLHLFYVMLHNICQVASFLKETERQFFQMPDDLQPQIRQAGIGCFMGRPCCRVRADGLSDKADQHSAALPKDLLPREGRGEV